jgi:hypothetical protein
VASPVGQAERARRFAAVAAAVLLVAGCGSSSPSQSSSAPGGSGVPGATAPSTAEAPSSAQPAQADALPTLVPPPIDVSGAPKRLHLGAAGGVSAWLGPAGGTVSTAASDGTTYQLDVPADALSDATPITMTPVDSIDDLGLSGGQAGSVYLGPVGLKLAVPAILTIVPSKAAPTGQRLVGFDIPDDGATTGIVPAIPDGTGIKVLVFHFSAPGAGFGTSQDVQLLAPATAASGSMSAALAYLLAEDAPWSAATSSLAAAGILTAWSNLMQPELSAVASDAKLLQVLADWRQFVLLMNLATHGGDIPAAIADGANLAAGAPAYQVNVFAAGQSLILARINDAIAGNLQLCATRNLNALANVAYWASVGAMDDPLEPAWSGRPGACAHIVAGSFNPASNLKAGGTDSLQIGFVIEFADTTKVPGDFQLSLQGGGFTFASTGTSMATAAQPVTSTVATVEVQATANPQYTLVATACWFLAGVARNLCSDNVSQSWGGGTVQPPASAQSSSGAPEAFYIDGGPGTSTAETCWSWVVFARYPNGQQYTGPVTWSTSGVAVRGVYPYAPGAVQVNTGPDPGTLTITGLVNGVTASVDVQVVKSATHTC